MKKNALKDISLILGLIFILLSTIELILNFGNIDLIHRFMLLFFGLCYGFLLTFYGTKKRLLIDNNINIRTMVKKIITTIYNEKIRNTLIILAATMLTVYLIDLTFISIQPKTKAIIGTIFQLIAGFVFTIDQVIKATATTDTINIWNIILKYRYRITIITSIVMFFILMLFVNMKPGITISLSETFSSSFGILFLNLLYLYATQQIQKLFLKHRSISKENSLILANTITLLISTPIIITSILIKGNLTLTIIVAILFTPTAIFSIFFLMAAFCIWLINFIRLKFNKTVLWWSLLILWIWGGLLILIDIFNRT